MPNTLRNKYFMGQRVTFKREESQEVTCYMCGQRIRKAETVKINIFLTGVIMSMRYFPGSSETSIIYTIKLDSGSLYGVWERDIIREVEDIW